MKFIVDMADFKSAAEKVIAITKDSHVNCVRISANSKSIVRIYGFSMSQTVEVSVYVTDVVAFGHTYINTDDMKKIFNLSGSVTIENHDNKIYAKSNKKCCIVKEFNCDDDLIEFGRGDNVTLFSTNASCFSDVLGVCDCARSKNEAIPIQTGFNLDGKTGRISTCDGYRLISKKYFDGSGDFNITIPGYVYQAIKKLINKKNEDMANLSVQYCKEDHSICFYGSDYQYRSKILDGNYIDIVHVLGNYSSNEFITVNANEMASVAKEYMKSMSAREKMPMYLFGMNKSDLFCALSTSNYQTFDRVNVVDSYFRDLETICFGYNAKYFYEAFNVFGNQDVNVYYKSALSPLVISTNELDAYETLVLPIRLNNENIANMKTMVSEVLA